jgi:hypothetical protein
MIHILTAYDYERDASGQFFMGCFMPDYTNERQRKDAIHMRDVEDRWGALAEFAELCGPVDAFREGWLFHLFTDACWEEGPLREYIEKIAPAGWFVPYREQTKLASYWLFHNLNWAQSVWDRIMEAPLNVTGIVHGPTIGEMDWYRAGVRDKHVENVAQTSESFPPDMLFAFAKQTAARYREWRSTNAHSIIE